MLKLTYLIYGNQTVYFPTYVSYLSKLENDDNKNKLMLSIYGQLGATISNKVLITVFHSLFNIYPNSPVSLAIDSSSEKIGGGSFSFYEHYD